jgi:hypothetical protein
VSLYQTIFELIDMRSFSNLWFWIMLCVEWWMVSHWVLGVPFDVILRARRSGGKAQAELEDFARVNVNRLLFITHMSGPWIVAFAMCLLTALAATGFWYRVEFAQAVFCLMFPLALTGLLSVRAAHRIADGAHQGEALQACLIKLRFAVQAVGLASILFTTIWGMYQNMTMSVLR